MHVQQQDLSWWELSDKYPIMIKIYETMAKLASHAIKLKADYVRLKSLTPSYRTCSECDLYLTEDLYHIIMQCPNMDTIVGTCMMHCIKMMKG